MYAVKAIYDGETFTPTQPIYMKEKYEVVITFIEPLKEIPKKEENNEKLNLLDLFGKVQFADDYDYKAMRGKIDDIG